MKEIGDKGHEWPQIIAILISSLTMLNAGILFTWTSPSISILTSDAYPLEITLEQASYFTVLPPVAVIISCVFFASVMDKIGRKYTLLLVAIPQLLSWTLKAVGGSIWVFYLSRFSAGLGDSIIFIALPVYVGEIATPKVRGSWGNAISFSIYLGSLLMNFIGNVYSIRITAFIFGTLPILFFCLFVFMPESPYFLIMKEREEEGRKALQWFRRKKNVDEEFKQICVDVKRQLSEPGTYKDLFTIPSNRMALFVGGITRFGQQFSGMSAFLVYSQSIFAAAGGQLGASESAIICSGVMAMSTLLAGVLVNKLGRRISLFSSGIACHILLLIMATYFYLNNASTETSIDLSSFQWIPIVGMIIFLVSFCLGIGPVPTLLLGELFSSSVKSKALAIMDIIFSIYVATSTKIFQLLFSAFGLHAPFYFYALSCFVSTVLNYFFVPETKGKTLEEIQQSMRKKNNETTEK